jgi:hypothetical protein
MAQTKWNVNTYTACEWGASSWFDQNTSSVQLAGSLLNCSCLICLSFWNITIPNAANVAAAYLTMKPLSNSGSPYLDIHLHLANNSAYINNTADAGTRPLTVAHTAWNSFTYGSVNVSPNFASALQEVVNLPGWVSGNNITVMLPDHTYKYNTVAPSTNSLIFDSWTHYVPTLMITYGPVLDIGLRGYQNPAHGYTTVSFACEPLGTVTSPLRVYKGGHVYGVQVIEPEDVLNASEFRVVTSTGVKAIRRI